MYTPSIARGRVNFQSFDQEYVRLLTEGDPTVERHFTAYFGELLMIKLRSRLRTKQLVEDARQETFLRVLTTLRRKDGLQYPERLGAFVNSVCNNVLLEAFRGEKRSDPLPEDNVDMADSGPDPELSLVSEERKKQVQDILEQLPEKQRMLLKMIFLEERDKSEVCEQLKVGRDYLRLLLHRAKSCFRTSYLKEEAGVVRK